MQWRRLAALVRDSAALSGRSRLAVLLDAAASRGGRAFAWDFSRGWLASRLGRRGQIMEA